MILPALLRPPCLVSFSGGRDSAAVLAAATDLARREGLEVPIPATNVFAAVAATDETTWQEQILHHLGLADWLRLDHTDELDVIGPYAQRLLLKHGLLWPSNTHFHLPLLDAARGGSLLTGIGGDELFTATRQSHAAALLCRTVSPRPRDVLRVGFELAPARIRRAMIARRQQVDFPWLRAEARRLATEQAASDAAREPRLLRGRMRWWQRLRYLQLGTASLELAAFEVSVMLVHPLLAPEFWSAAAEVAAPHGFTGRADGMQRLFGDLVPAEIVQRTSKARFDEVCWTDRARAFAGRWDGCGVPDEFVDAEALALNWAQAKPSAQSFTLLQSAWLESTTRPRPGDVPRPRPSSPMSSAWSAPGREASSA